ncbi:dihydrofolate reductase family protein [Vulgatibacter sp.]|uniref:dihydrofolate reductase family protein n=1 Tax=Vulgatibacter sp. TaxID=1971226 RepID=UPI0035619575
MRKLVTMAMISLDGVMQAPGGPEEDPSGGFELGGWVFPLFDEAGGAAIDEVFSAPFDLLLGRKTYDIFAAYWPFIPTDPAANGFDEGNAQIARRFNAVTKYVATHRPESLRWQNSQSLGDDVVARLREMKREDGPPLLTQGSSELVQTLLAHDLVDELRLLIFPVLLGRGKRLFGEGTKPAAFTLEHSTVTPKGVIITRYVRAGDVATGTFARD